MYVLLACCYLYWSYALIPEGIEEDRFYFLQIFAIFDGEILVIQLEMWFIYPKPPHFSKS